MSYELFKRRLSIECDPVGNVVVQDIDTDEYISDISVISIHIKPGTLTEVRITHADMDSNGHPVIEKTMANNVLISGKRKFRTDKMRGADLSSTIQGPHYVSDLKERGLCQVDLADQDVLS